MKADKHFFLRDAWTYNPAAPRHMRADANTGFETKTLHTGFHPLESKADFSSFTTPMVQSVTFLRHL